MSAIAVIGEAVADAIVEPGIPGEVRLRVMPGGGPVNTAVALSRLGTPVRYLGRLASSEIGTLLRRHLAESNVDTRFTIAASEPASLAIATISSLGGAEYSFYVNGTADWAWTSAELEAINGHSMSAIHAGSLALALEPGASRVIGLLRRLKASTTVCIDPNVRLSLVSARFYQSALPVWAGIADMLKLSDDDLAAAMPGVPVPNACAQLHELGTPLVVVTRGAYGVYASLRGQTLQLPAPPVTVADTVGAGDTFTAGVLHQLETIGALGGRLDRLSTSDLIGALELGLAAAAVTCSRVGADPPWASELLVGSRFDG